MPAGVDLADAGEEAPRADCGRRSNPTHAIITPRDGGERVEDEPAGDKPT